LPGWPRSRGPVIARAPEVSRASSLIAKGGRRTDAGRVEVRVEAGRLQAVRHELLGLVGRQAVLLRDGGDELSPVFMAEASKVERRGVSAATSGGSGGRIMRREFAGGGSPEERIGEMVVMWAGRLNDMVRRRWCLAAGRPRGEEA
jgi:hypothetical protein